MKNTVSTQVLNRFFGVIQSFWRILAPFWMLVFSIAASKYK